MRKGVCGGRGMDRSYWVLLHNMALVIIDIVDNRVPPEDSLLWSF